MATGCRIWPWPTFQQRLGADQQHAVAALKSFHRGLRTVVWIRLKRLC
jgi:hypothetical protein